MQIRMLKDKRVLITSQRIMFKALTIMACQLMMAIGAITYYWNANGAVPAMDFRT
jgi:hypothetical protein